MSSLSSAVDAAAVVNLSPFKEKRRSTMETPDIGILGKDFDQRKGKQTIDSKKFILHRKNRAAADVDVGILDKRRQRGGGQRQQQAFNMNLHLRSLQSEEELPLMCPTKNGRPGSGWRDIGRLFDETDGYFPKCSCPSPTTCGPELCTCLELDADGDILQCMDPLEQLCEGTMYIDGVPGPWSMEKCLGSKSRAINYCSNLPCFVDGGSYWQCKCNRYDYHCTEYRDSLPCTVSKCCQAQTDDEGREACINGDIGDIYENYYDEGTHFWISREEMIPRFNECSFSSGSGKSIVQCYCESFSHVLCVNHGVFYPDLCEAMNCCYGETEDDARLDCFSRSRNWRTGHYFYNYRDTIQESCVASGRSSDQCKCDIHGLSNCVDVESESSSNREPRCDLFQCCQSQTDGNDLGR